LFACGISTNARYAFGRRVIRIGVQEVTRRGMRADEMREIAKFIWRATNNSADAPTLRRDIIHFGRSFPEICYSFDADLKTGLKSCTGDQSNALPAWSPTAGSSLNCSNDLRKY
jgi:hypothetical protein